MKEKERERASSQLREIRHDALHDVLTDDMFRLHEENFFCTPPYS